MDHSPGVPKARRFAPISGRRTRYRPKYARPVMAAPHGRMLSPAQPRFLPVGDLGISIEFGTEITEQANDAVASLDHAIAAADLPGIVETVPSFRSLLVTFEPALTDRSGLLERLRSLTATADARLLPPGRRWSVPVVYDTPFGEDLPQLSDLLGLSPREIVAAHTSTNFRVYMLGFQPGLPNLGGLPPALHISRRTTPRPPVPGGSVTIGGIQAAIMPLPTPTGFYLLGRTPIRLFDRRRPEPALFRAGDWVRFRAIPPSEFEELSQAVAAGQIDAGAVLEPEHAP